TQLRALRALEKLYTTAASWPELAKVVERQLSLTAGNDADTRVALSHQLGELHETRLQKTHEALGHYRAAYQLMPSHKPTQAALERWIAPELKTDANSDPKVAAADRVEVARLLLPVYEQRDDARRMVDALDILLAATPDSEQAKQLELLWRLADLA